MAVDYEQRMLWVIRDIHDNPKGDLSLYAMIGSRGMFRDISHWVTLYDQTRPRPPKKIF